MVEIMIDYTGKLRCQATHEPSGITLLTDAPKDNMGQGASFSPTDLIATALGTCMLTTMAIAAHRLEIEFPGGKMSVKKEMVAAPTRRIGTLTVVLTLPVKVTPEQKQKLENAAINCPVAKSLNADVKVPVEFNWI